MEQTQSQQMRQELRQFLRMEQATLLEMPEEDFHKLILKIEKSPLFQRLYQKDKLIGRQRFPGTDISSSFYQLKEDIVSDKGSLDVESLLLNKEQITGQIQKLGLEKFKRYFLFPESGRSQEELAKECDLTVSEVQSINSLIDDFSILSEFYHPSNFSSGEIHYFKIASIERAQDGFIIGYFSPSSARGRYSIDYERFEQLKAESAFTDTEIKEAKELFSQLELINSRKDTLSQILHNIIDRQSLYLQSGDLKSLLPFSQKELAKNIELAPSSVSRAISGKSIDTPWGAEIPLKQFFPTPRRFKQEILRQLLESGENLSSDEVIRIKLQDKFGIAISRRSVANLRNALKFPAARRSKARVPQEK